MKVLFYVYLYLTISKPTPTLGRDFDNSRRTDLHPTGSIRLRGHRWWAWWWLDGCSWVHRTKFPGHDQGIPPGDLSGVVIFSTSCGGLLSWHFTAASERFCLVVK